MSKYRDGAVVRRERMMRIVAYIGKNPGVTIDRIQAWVSWNIGLAPRTTGQYVQGLVHMGLLAEDGQGFCVTGKKI